MKQKIFYTMVVVGLIISACSSEEISKRDTTLDSLSRQADSSKKFNPLDLEPTNPTGGIVEGRLKKISEQESLRRKERNQKEPMKFGYSVAGINMSMNYNEIHDILANPIFADNNTEYFPEGISIDWTNDEPRMPFRIIIRDSYKGTITIPKIDQPIAMGTPISDYYKVTVVQDFLPFMNILAAGFENKDPSTFDCVKNLTCRFDSIPEFNIQDFALGGLYWDTKTNLLAIAYFEAPRQLPPFVVAPFAYGTSFGGVSYTTTKTQAEAFLGKPLEVDPNNALHYYDGYNLAIAWNEQNLPELVLGINGFRGKLSIDGTVLDIGIGSPIKKLSATIDTTSPQSLAVSLNQFLEKNTSDCLATGECFVVDNEKVITVFTQRGRFGLSKTAAFPIREFGLIPALIGGQ